MPSQFIRLNCYGERPSARRKPHENANDILDEAARISGSVDHVPKPRPPNHLYGVPLAVTRARLTEYVGVVRDRRGAHVRRGGTVLYSIVVSYPMAWRQIGSVEELTDYNRWRDATVGWLQLQFGEQLQSVVEHVDEGRPHVHAFVIPPLCPGNRVDHRLHPGHVARDAVFREGGDRLAGERAYREGMRRWQDDFHTAVSCHFGHGRVGPRRQRFRRDVALMRQSSDRVLECAEAILQRLMHRLDRLLTDSQEAADIDGILKLVSGARGRLLMGRSDALEILTTALDDLIGQGKPGSGTQGETVPFPDLLKSTSGGWGDDDDPSSDVEFDGYNDVDTDDDPGPEAPVQTDFASDSDAGLDHVDELGPSDLSEDVDPDS